MIPQPTDTAAQAVGLHRAVRRRWRDRGLTGRPQAPPDADAPAYVIHVTGVPTTGPVDAGRTTVHTAADVIARHRAMTGARIEHVLGWDCRPGVPAGRTPDTAAQVEQDARIRRALCCDDDTVCVVTTMDPTYVDSVWWAVAQLWESGLVHDVPATARWCRACSRTIDQSEVTVVERTATTALVRFPVLGDNPLCTAGASLLVAVHHMAALPSVGVVATTPATDLVLAQGTGDAYPLVLARTMVAPTLGHDATIHRDVAVDEVDGLRCRHPSTSGDVTVTVVTELPGDETGFAPGPDDTVLSDDADVAQVDALCGTGLLLRVDRHDPIVERCATCGGRVRSTDERGWAVATSRVAGQLAAERAAVARRNLTGTTPAAPGDASDMVISRRGAHGIPLPLWRCDACDHVTAVSGRARLATLAGCDADTLDADDGSIEAATFPCRACGDGTAQHVGLVTDTCVDAGAMPFARFGFPALPGSDAHVARRCHADLVIDPTGTVADAMLVVASLLWDAGSHDAVLTTGTMDGAHVDVEGLCGRHGADAVRWAAVTSTAEWLDGARCDELAAGAVEALVTPLLDACTSFEKASADAAWSPADLADVAAVTARPVWDRWILAELADATAVVRLRLDDLDLAGAAQRIRAFVMAIARWRSQRSADPRATAERDGASALATFHECLVTVAALLAPFTPFLSDELFERLVRSSEPVAPDSVHLLRYPVPHTAARDDDLRRSMRVHHDHGLRLAHDVVRVVNELRVHHGVDGDERITVRIDADAEVAAAVETHRRTIADGVLASRIELGPTEDGVPVPLNDAPARLALRWARR